MKTLIFLSLVLTSSLGWSVSRSITVKGECLSQVSQDRVSITLTPEFREKDLNVATQKTHEQYAKLKEEVLKLGLKDLELQTTQYNVSEDREWKDGRSKVLGFIVTMGMQVETSEIQKSQKVLEIAQKLAIKNVGSLNTFASRKTVKEAQDKCLAVAIKDAEAKAALMAKAVGAKVGKALFLKEESTFVEQPGVPTFQMREAKSMMMADASPGNSVDTRNQDIKTTVFAEFAMD